MQHRVPAPAQRLVHRGIESDDLNSANTGCFSLLIRTKNRFNTSVFSKNAKTEVLTGYPENSAKHLLLTHLLLLTNRRGALQTVVKDHIGRNTKPALAKLVLCLARPRSTCHVEKKAE